MFAALAATLAVGCSDTTAVSTTTTTETSVAGDTTITEAIATVASDPPPSASTADEVAVTALPSEASSTTIAPTTSDLEPDRFAVPVADVAAAGWGDTHSAYPATDVFVAGGCGAEIVSPVDGQLLEVRREDSWVEDVDNPATRGGRSVSILSDDGVRYYLAHFDVIEPDVAVGARVSVGQELGTIGETGRTSACHLHFGISPPCPEKEWSVRRGVIWPFPYLNAWRDGEPRSPRDEVESWSAANPNACADASADPFAPDS